MLGNIKDSLRYSVNKSTDLLVSFFSKIKNFLIENKEELLNIRSKIKDLYKTNFELGKYHLYNGKYIDAIFRMIILKRFIKDTHESSYILGWAYLLGGNVDKALRYFDDSEMVTKEFVEDFLKLKDSSENLQILEDFITEYKTLSPYHYLNQIDENLYKELIVFGLEASASLPKKLRLLDVAPTTGQIIPEFSARVSRDFNSESLDHIDRVVMSLENKHSYHNHHISNFIKFFEENKHAFSIVLTVCGFNFTSNFEGYAKVLSRSITERGYFWGVFDLTPNQKCIESRTWARISITNVTKALEDSKFIVVDQKELTLNKKKYLFIVAQNTLS